MNDLHEEQPNARYAGPAPDPVANLLDRLIALRSSIHACNRNPIPRARACDWRDVLDGIIADLRGDQPPASSPSHCIGLQNAEPAGQVHYVGDARAPGRIAEHPRKRVDEPIQPPCDVEPA